jgi:predicted O-linked N-acetylglucosamine transferase (SPINDLY family)
MFIPPLFLSFEYLSIIQSDMNHTQQQVQNYLIRKDYSQAASLCEQAIATEPHVISHYWYLGLLQLLQQQEVEAQSTWLLGMSACESGDDLAQVDKWTSELSSILQTEAVRQESIEDLTLAWLIRRHSHEINSADINNLLHMVRLSVQLQTMTASDLIDLQVIESLQEAAVGTVYPDLLSELVTRVLDYPPLYPSLIEFIEACIPHVYYPYYFVVKLIHAAVSFFYYSKQIELAIKLLEICLRLKHEEIEVLNHLSPMYQNIGQYQKSIDTARLCCNLSEKITDRVFASQLLLRALIGSGGHWQEVVTVFAQHQALTQTLIEAHPIDLASAMVMRFYLTGFFAPYLRDLPRLDRTMQNQLAQICQENAEIYASEAIDRYQKSHNARRHQEQPSTRPLRIGYLSQCLNTHSVGWLARWLLKHHDRDRFEIFGYFSPYKQTQDPLQDWYVEQFARVYRAGIDGSSASEDIAERIFQDEIDILIELDSITLDGTCSIVALKPAPVQVTWLGWDASGIPAIDYFIADPYVLPDSAQEYYSEKIWRLPETYIAVDGFEVAVPSLRRDQLDIPDDGVIYLSAQKGYKRHPDTIRLQMQIVKAVPNSFFLIKGTADQDKMRDFFIEIAQEEGVDINCLRFLPTVESEAVHRANLAVADVVLDTYPYNGATTTLETLWMGVPLVTHVGEQFAARNSYTMMVNAGISEGIAWTDREYVEWGIRFGTEPELRKEVSWKLRESKKTSPLWNAERFTRHMEDAYEQMWEKFQGSAIAEFPEQPLVEPIPEKKLLVIPEAEYQNGLGIGFAQQGQIDRAIACFESAISIQAEYADAHYNLGIARSEQNNVEAAIACFTQAINCNPQYTSAYLNLGLTFAKQERYSEANEMYKSALALAPHDVDILLAMGNLLFEQRQLDLLIWVNFIEPLPISSLPINSSLIMLLPITT